MKSYINYKEAKEDILELDIFNYKEIEENKYNDSSFKVFSSWEYYQIFYLSNADLYYLDEEIEKALKEADLIENTKKGRIYCFS